MTAGLLRGQPYEGGATAVPITQLKKLRLRQAEHRAQVTDRIQPGPLDRESEDPQILKSQGLQVTEFSCLLYHSARHLSIRLDRATADSCCGIPNKQLSTCCLYPSGDRRLTTIQGPSPAAQAPGTAWKSSCR